MPLFSSDSMLRSKRRYRHLLVLSFTLFMVLSFVLPIADLLIPIPYLRMDLFRLRIIDIMIFFGRPYQDHIFRALMEIIDDNGHYIELYEYFTPFILVLSSIVYIILGFIEYHFFIFINRFILGRTFLNSVREVFYKMWPPYYPVNAVADRVKNIRVVRMIFHNVNTYIQSTPFQLAILLTRWLLHPIILFIKWFFKWFTVRYLFNLWIGMSILFLFNKAFNPDRTRHIYDTERRFIGLMMRFPSHVVSAWMWNLSRQSVVDQVESGVFDNKNGHLIPGDYLLQHHPLLSEVVSIRGTHENYSLLFAKGDVDDFYNRKNVVVYNSKDDVGQLYYHFSDYPYFMPISGNWYLGKLDYTLYGNIDRNAWDEINYIPF